MAKISIQHLVLTITFMLLLISSSFAADDNFSGSNKNSGDNSANYSQKNSQYEAIDKKAVENKPANQNRKIFNSESSEDIKEKNKAKAKPSQHDTILDEPEDEVVVWYGNLDSSPIPVLLNQHQDINVYVHTQSHVYVADMMLALGAQDQYIDSLYSEIQGEFLYPFTEWDEAGFNNPDSSPPNPAGWSSQSFVGFARLSSHSTSPFLHFSVPTHILTYAMKTVNDPAVLGDVANCLGIGMDPLQGPSNAGDSLGGAGFSITEFFSPFYFVSNYIAGNVVNQDLEPLENVFVQDLSSSIYDSTDINGDYTLKNVTVGYHNVSFSHPYCADTIVYSVRVFSGQTTYVDVVMQEMGWIEGIVRNEDMTPIESVYVEVNGESIDDYTNISGEYNLGPLNAGTYTLAFSHPYYLDKTVYNTAVVQGDTTQLDVVLDYLGALDGIVRDQYSAPIESVLVEIESLSLQEYTNSAGEYFIEYIDPGTYSVSFSHPDYWDTTAANINIVSGDTTTCDMIMHLLGSIGGIVTKTDGTTLLDNVLVRLFQDSTELDSFTTEMDGAYIFTHLPPGLYNIEASKAGFVTNLIEDIAVFLDDTITVDIMLVEDIGSIAGIVTSGGSPIESVYVAALFTMANDFTDAIGEYELNGLPSGFYSVKFTKIGYEEKYSANIEVFPEQETILNVSLDERPIDITATLYSNGFYRANLDGFYYCEYRNEGLMPAGNVELELSLANEVNYIDSDPAGSYFDGTVSWLLGNLNPGQSGGVWVYFNVPSGTPEGSMLIGTALITTSSVDTDLTNNYTSISVEVVGSWDSQEKIASPPGYGERKFIPESEKLIYTVFFENGPVSPVYINDVIISDTLDLHLDWSSFAFGPVSHPLDCSTSFDPSTGIISWIFDDIALPQNIVVPEGEGFAEYSIDPYAGLANETEITNRAGVKFDSDPWVMCPYDEPLLRTIDNQLPVSAVSQLPETYMEDTFTVNWTASDFTGSGIASVEVYVSVNGGSFNFWYAASPLEPGHKFYGDFDSCYAFYSIATDNVGNVEETPLEPDASICLQYGYAYLMGDVNMALSLWPPRFIGSDVIYLLNYFKGLPSIPCWMDGFWASADVNGDCMVMGSDVTRMVQYFKGGIVVIQYCPDYRPAWLTPDDIPDEMPTGWPNCETLILNEKVIPAKSESK